MFLFFCAFLAFAGASLESEVFVLQNNYRVANGLAPLMASKALIDEAERYSGEMKSKNEFKHSVNLAKNAPAGWKRLGENIARGQTTAQQVFNAWRASPGHNANMLGDFNYVGIGHVDTWWTVQFAKYPASAMKPWQGTIASPSWPVPFADAVGNTFENDIAFLSSRGIVTPSPSDPTKFAPSASLDRGTFAVWMYRAAKHLVSTKFAPVNFKDVTSHKTEISWMSATGVTRGTGPTTYSPKNPVTRGQMAAFFNRAFGKSGLIKPTGAALPFTDMGTTFPADITWMSKTGITKGCSRTKFCTVNSVTRGQMAAFLARGLKQIPTF